MLMLSVEGWLNGLTAVGIFVFGGGFGIFFAYQSKKTNAKLLMNLSIFLMLTMWVYWGVCFDFFTLIFTGTVWFPQGSTVEDLRTIFVWMAGGLISIAGISIGTKLLAPNKKWYFLSIILFLNIIYLAFLFLDVRGTIESTYENEIPLGYIIPGTLAHTAIMIQSFIFLIINVGGFLYKATQSTGIIRKKFIFLSLGFLFFLISLVTEGFISEILTLIFARFGMIISFWIVYLGLKEEPEKPQEPIKKKIKVEGDLFRLIQNRPKDITEEEVIYHKEQEICLVCKGSTSRLTYICPDCKTLYCIKCSEALTDLENACWVCNTPIDPSKPSKPYEKGEERPKLEISEKDKKS